ncbi:MAG TPA: 7TM diverse intracellular signaling domain-containing protein [Puia sp.]|uniref:sensor histidine kinase n=1 Tax=Puia sp. TaxID=2045100 RepID=UPI002CC9C0B1|nr:7TM diverse intracellular signaling domain-containing protein [Puia sp.]HVU97631.1 7TM diverse intracellular signaling domain-containing protein [Puia sp.]
MRRVLLLFYCLLIAGLCHGQAVANFAAKLSVDSVVCRVDSAAVTDTVLFREMGRSVRNHVFMIGAMLHNNSDSAVPFSLGYGELDYIDARMGSQRVQGGTLRRTPAGASYLQRQTGALPLRLSPHATQWLSVTIRQRTDEYSFDGIALYDENSLNAAFVHDLPASNGFLILQMLFQGFLLCQLLYAFFQWLMVRRPEYLYYFLYMLLIGLYFLSKQEGLFGTDVLFTRWPVLKIYLGKTLLILPYYVYFRFIRSFLEIPRDHPRLNRWIVRLEVFLLGYAAFDFIFIVATFDRGFQTLVYTVVFAGVFLLTLGFMIYMYRRRQALIFYIISGSLCVATGHILGLIFSYLEINRHIDLGVPDIFVFPQAGIVLEVLCFTAGLSYKSLMTEREKLSSQEKLIEQLKANELLQQRMQHIRNKIAQDLHDDIGSTLSSISILSDLALRENSGSQTMETMNEIKDSSILLMERMDDIVWSINPRNDSLENLLMRVRHFATTLFEARGVDYVIDIQRNINEVRLPMDYRQHIYLILKEAINNLVKYADATQAWLEVRFDERHLVLAVRDNGKGFDSSRVGKGNGLTGMQRRAGLMNARVEIVSAPGQGSSVRLQVDIA